jgi:MFS family permease
MGFIKTEPQTVANSDRDIPVGVKMLASARAIRWIGWGLGEALIPVFLVSFSHTFLQLGIFSSLTEMAALVSLPIIGVWADKGPARRLVLISLLLYPLIGGSFFLAGAMNLAVFVVLAKVINGFTWEMENVGIETYYRRVVHHTRIATSFGFLDTWSNAGWIFAAIIGALLVHYVPIYYLLFGISPFALIAYLVAARAPADHVQPIAILKRASLPSIYKKSFAEFYTWNSKLRLLAVLVLFSSIMSAFTDIYIPIDAYLSGANLPMVVLLAIFCAIPSVFGYFLGRLADGHHKGRSISIGLCLVALAMSAIVIFPQYKFKLVAVFTMGIVLELFSVVKGSLITVLGPANRYGIRCGVFESIGNIGDIAAPIAIGVGIDSFGFSKLSIMVVVAAIVLSMVFCWKRDRK